MLKRYSIWDKKSPVIVPTGKIFTAEEWIEQYPIAGLSHITVVGSAGEINGGYFGTLGQMVQMYEVQGCDFSECTTNLEKLEAIEAFEDKMNTPVENPEPSTDERIAAALEYQVMASLPDETAEEV